MKRLSLLLFTVLLLCLISCAPAPSTDSGPRDLVIGGSWQSDYPVAALDRLPAGQQQNRVGWIGEDSTFIRVWDVFMPDEPVPEVDFTKSLVVFTRNVDFYNRTNIFKVTLENGIIEILAMETMSAMPIEEQVAMAMAVVPRNGVKAIRLDASTTVPVD